MEEHHAKLSQIAQVENPQKNFRTVVGLASVNHQGMSQ